MLEGFKECIEYMINNKNERIYADYSGRGRVYCWFDGEQIMTTVGGIESFVSYYDSFNQKKWHKEELDYKEPEKLLNGKYIVVNHREIPIGTVVSFLEGDAIVEVECGHKFEYHGLKGDGVYKDANIELESYKEHLTISELEYRTDNKSYVDGNNELWNVVRGNLINEEEEDITDMHDLDRLLEFKFTEVNPKQERIDELEKLIELGCISLHKLESDLREVKTDLESTKVLYESYREELKELQGNN